MIEAFVPVSTTLVAGYVSSYLVLFLGFTLICILFQYHWKRRRLYKLASKLSGPPPLPIIGNAHIFLGIENSEEMHETIKNLVKKFMPQFLNGPLRLWLGPQLAVIVGKPEDLHILLTSPKSMEKCLDFYKCLYPIMGFTPLLYKPVKLWKPHRKLFQTSLTKIKCLEYMEEFQEPVDDFLDDLKEIIKVGITPENLANTIDIAVVRSVSKCLMGTESTDKGRVIPFAEAARWLLDVEFQRMVKVWLHNDFLFKFSHLYKLEEHHLICATKYIDWIIETKKEIRARNRRLESKNIDFAYERRLLDTFFDMEDNGELTARQLRDEIVVFFGAAMDTTSFSTQVTLLMLAMHPDVQEKLYNEINEIYGDSDRPVVAEDLPRLKYLDMVMRESIRLYTPIPIVARLVTEDLKLDKHVLPAGTVAIASPLAVHQNPEIYPNPEKFDPERFSPDIKRHPYSFLPFSGGPRNCIGYTFAFILMKVLLTNTVRKYKMTTDCKHSDIKIKLKLTSTLTDAKPIRFEERTKML